MKTNLIEVSNRIGKVRLNDSVNPWSTDDLIGDIERLYGQKAVAENMSVGGFVAAADDALETLELEIHSPGGSVLDGYRVYHALQSMRERGVEVVATVNTLAASMASVIVMAASKIRIMEGGRIMIHEASQTVSGDSEDHARSAKILDEMSDEIAQLYANRTGSDKSDIRKLMKAETWMGAAEALERGFADEIIKPTNKTLDKTSQKSNCADMSFLDRLTSPSDSEAKSRIEALENTISAHDLVVVEFESKLAAAENALQEAAELKVENINLRAKADLIEGFESKVSDLESIKSELTEKLEAKQLLDQEVVATAAAQLLAAQGHGEPLKIDGEKPTGVPVNEITIAQFNELKPHEKMNFVKSGGKLS